MSPAANSILSVISAFVVGGVILLFIGKNPFTLYGQLFLQGLGSSLGVDPISGDNKVCSFDCVYCQLGRTESLTDERKIFVPTEEIMKEHAEIERKHQQQAEKLETEVGMILVPIVGWLC